MAKQLCVLCGEKPATKGKGDHLPPRCLYSKELRAKVQMNTVPACVDCNNAGSGDDEVLKMIIGLTTGEVVENSDQVLDALARTMSANARLGRQVAAGRYVYAGSSGGVLRPAVAVSFERGAYVRAITRMIRGLFWMKTGSIMGEKSIHVWHGDELKEEYVDAIRILLPTLEPASLNGGTFIYKVSLDEDGSSFWALQFFGKHTVFAVVEPDGVRNQSAHTA